MQIVRIDAYPWDIAMRAPYRSAQRTTTVAQNVLVELELADGTIGYGESAPAQYVTSETQALVLRAVNLAASRLVGKQAPFAAEIITEHLVTTPGASAALETALYDAMARATNLPLYRLMGADEDALTARETDISIPLISPDDASQRAKEAVQNGFRAIKIKVGSNFLDEDVNRVRAIAEAAPHAQIRLDGNQAFTGDEALRLVERLYDLLERIELFEQPTKAKDDKAMKFVHDRIPFPVFADESCHKAEDAGRLISEGICGGVVLKIAKSGLTGTYAMAQVTHEAGGKCLFGCMMESHLGISAALHLALALGEATVPMLDLDGHLLVDDTNKVAGGPTQNGATISIDPTQPGLGVRILSEE
jgi:o-succinylbenzoate synthase